MGGSQPGGGREKGKGRRGRGEGVMGTDVRTVGSDSWWFRATAAAATATAVKDVLPCFALFCPPPPPTEKIPTPYCGFPPTHRRREPWARSFFFFFFFLFSFEADPSIYHLFLVYVACLLSEIQKCYHTYLLVRLYTYITPALANQAGGGFFFSAVHQNVNVKNATQVHMQSYYKLKLKQYIYSSSPPSPTCIYIYIQGRRRTPHPTPHHPTPSSLPLLLLSPLLLGRTFAAHLRTK